MDLKARDPHSLPLKCRTKYWERDTGVHSGQDPSQKRLTFIKLENVYCRAQNLGGDGGKQVPGTPSHNYHLDAWIGRVSPKGVSEDPDTGPKDSVQAQLEHYMGTCTARMAEVARPSQRADLLPR